MPWNFFAATFWNTIHQFTPTILRLEQEVKWWPEQPLTIATKLRDTQKLDVLQTTCRLCAEDSCLQFLLFGEHCNLKINSNHSQVVDMDLYLTSAFKRNVVYTIIRQDACYTILSFNSCIYKSDLTR